MKETTIKRHSQMQCNGSCRAAKCYQCTHLQCAFIRRSRSHSLEECVREREGKTGVTTETSWQDDRDDSSSFFCAPQLAADLEQ